MKINNKLSVSLRFVSRALITIEKPNEVEKIKQELSEKDFQKYYYYYQYYQKIFRLSRIVWQMSKSKMLPKENITYVKPLDYEKKISSRQIDKENKNPAYLLKKIQI